MALEEIPEFEILAEYVEALVAAQAFEFGGTLAAIHAGGQGAALEAVAAKIAAAEAGVLRAGFDDGGAGPAGDRLRAEAGPGRSVAPAGVFFASQMRRKTAPVVMPALFSQAVSARTGQSSVWP